MLLNNKGGNYEIKINGAFQLSESQYVT